MSIPAPTRTIATLVVHCSATPNGRAVSAAEIDRWHRQRGFARQPAAVKQFNPSLTAIGYHFVVGVDGIVQTGRAAFEVGAHAAGHNAHTLGICMVGTDQYTAAQWASLRRLLRDLRLHYPGAHVCGHRDLSPDRDGDGVVEPHEWLKTCPGFDAGQWHRLGMPVPCPGHTLPVATHA